MDFSDVATGEYRAVDAGTRLGSVRSAPSGATRIAERRSLIRCTVRVCTDDSFVGTGEEYGTDTALGLAPDRLERDRLDRRSARTKSTGDGSSIS